ncbi:MAG: hypothetical protein OEW12_02065 [Deltaproteobacteria bacterium]|nr:hypothetical protein [Deltaproteobacteria bacterium]
MQNDNPADFATRYHQGTFKGVLTWEKLDGLWALVRGGAADGWHLYTLGEPPPDRPADPAQVKDFVSRMDTLLRERHKHSHCGMVYVDNPRRPTFIQVYDPHKSGGCGVGGLGGARVRPGWILSIQPPVDLAPPEPKTRSWWGGASSKA